MALAELRDAFHIRVSDWSTGLTSSKCQTHVLITEMILYARLNRLFNRKWPLLHRTWERSFILSYLSLLNRTTSFSDDFMKQSAVILFSVQRFVEPSPLNLFLPCFLINFSVFGSRPCLCAGIKPCLFSAGLNSWLFLFYFFY